MRLGNVSGSACLALLPSPGFYLFGRLARCVPKIRHASMENSYLSMRNSLSFRIESHVLGACTAFWTSKARSTHLPPGPVRRTTFGRSISPSFTSERLDVSATGSNSNWITHAPVNEEGFLTEVAWIPSYWAGEPYPNATPIWETLVEGRMIVLGTSLPSKH